MTNSDNDIHNIPAFRRDFFTSDEIASKIGFGEIGGKASGLIGVKATLEENFPEGKFQNISIGIPRMVVIASSVFDRFMERNGLWDKALSDIDDRYLAQDFHRADFPAEVIGDLRGLVDSTRRPLAIRSSSVLEDAMFRPLAGVYCTKMIPNNQPDTDARFRMLIEAIKLIYASAFFRTARDYHRAAGLETRSEKMAVIIQEVVGEKHYERFYPNLSGVARSYNFYPMGRSKPEEGVIDLALGLGKTIVDGSISWTYSPAQPRVAPPTGSVRELLKSTQTKFWAVNLGKPPEYDPLNEDEYLVSGELSDAEYDNTLKELVSTYRPENDRLVTGMGNPGPRVLTFAPLLSLESYPLNNLLKQLLKICESKLGAPVEIEFAMNIDHQGKAPARFGFLQVRPMVVSDEEVTIAENEIKSENVLVSSDRVLGNGTIDTISDIVYVAPDKFDVSRTKEIAEELSQMNRKMIEAGGKYLLIGFGRWGSSDPWLGIPVEWGMISNASVIVEAALPEMNKEMSQGSHFFHNLTSFKVFYFSVPLEGVYRINWEALKDFDAVEQSKHLVHARCKKPLAVKVDGRRGLGVISYG